MEVAPLIHSLSHPVLIVIRTAHHLGSSSGLTDIWQRRQCRHRGVLLRLSRSERRPEEGGANSEIDPARIDAAPV